MPQNNFSCLVIPSQSPLTVTVHNSGPTHHMTGVVFAPYTVTTYRVHLGKQRCLCLREIRKFRETTIAVRSLLDTCQIIHDCNYHNTAMQRVLADYALRWLENNSCYNLWSLEDPEALQRVCKWLLRDISMGRP